MQTAFFYSGFVIRRKIINLAQNKTTNHTNMKISAIILPVLSICAIACASGDKTAELLAADGEKYVQHLTFPEGATIEEKVDMVARLVPSERQLAWQRSELTAFLHFGINTFTDREWGNGQEDPAIFNPECLDAAQWVYTLKECGFEMVILTAKHHDGFCLWPTATTSHSVASSPWRDGKGDVVAEVAHACADAGMKFGVYLSPWDRHAECYGDSPRYNEYFVAQLTELLSNYGKISEVWFDGACGEGPNGKKQVYDWDSYLATIRRLQPDAVSAVMGEDVRWVGNEGGVGRETEWSATVLTPGIYERADDNNAMNEVGPMAKDLGSREKLVNAREAFWYPSEVDVSIRPGWFWHKHENSQVKSLERLADIYFSSVGRNSVLLLNIPPDAEGLLNQADVARLREFAEWRKSTFADNRVKNGGRLTALHEGESVEYALKDGSKIDVVMVCEHIQNGQRVEKFTVEVLAGDGWREVAQGTTVGCKRLLRIEPVEAKALRVRIDQCRATTFIDCVGAFLSAPVSVEDDGGDSHLKPAQKRALSADPLTFDLGSEQQIAGFKYSPADSGAPVTNYRMLVSGDGAAWSCVSEDEFGNIVNNPIPQFVALDSAVAARYVRFEGFANDEKREFAESEIEVLVPVVKR